MPWYKRLRWRLIGSQFLVAIVGVLIMMLATRFVILARGPDVLRPLLTDLIADPSRLDLVEQQLTLAFRDAVLLSVLFAAVGAVAAGVASSYLMWRTIIRPLRQVADGSRRITGGRYSERVQVPQNSGEAMAELVTNFNEMAEALAAIEQQRVTLLANVAHELRTPLTGLKGTIEGLLDGLFPADEETFGLMLQEVDRLGRLVQDIQRLSRVEAGQISLELTTFDLATTTAQVQSQLLSQATAKGVAFELEETADPIMVYADPDRTAQVLVNLISNALRYTPEGGRIELSIRQEGSRAHVIVRDTGIGIPADALPYIFERFYRVDHSRARSSGGSGIGLTISRHLAWAMGGEIEADSPGAGLGSTFTLSLPTGKPDGR
jgi:histidine kinase